MTKNYQWILLADDYSGETMEVPVRAAARYTGRSVTTARRWAAGAPIGRRDLALLRFHALGVIDHPEWRRFRLRGGALVDVDTGESWTADQLRASWVLFQQAVDYRRLMRRQRAPVLELHPGGRRLRRAL